MRCKFLLLQFQLFFFILISSSQDLRLGIPFGHTFPVEFAEFSHHGKLIATSGWDEKPMIWEAATGRMLFMIKGHSSRIVSARFSPDDKKLLTASFDRTVKLWDLSTGKMIWSIDGFNNEPASASFSNNGKNILVGDMFERKLLIYDAANGILVKSIAGFSQNIRSASYSQDDRLIGVVVMDSIAHIMDVSSGRKLFDLKGHKKEIADLSFSKNKKWIVTADKEGVVKLWDAVSGKIIKTFPKETSEINMIRFSPDNKLLGIASHTGDLVLYNIETGKAQRIIKEGDNLMSVDFNNENTLVLSSSGMGFVSIYNVSGGDIVERLKKHTFIVNAAALPDNGKMIVSYWDGAPRVWDLKSGQVTNVIPPDPDEGFIYVFSSKDGNWYVKGSNRKNIKVFQRGKTVPEYEIFIDVALGCFPVISKDNQYFYFNDANALRCVELKTGKEIYRSESEENLTAPVFDEQQKLILTRMGASYAKNKIVVWEVSTGKQLRVIEINGEFGSASFNKDGSRIYVQCDETLLKVFDTKTGNEIASWAIGQKKFWSFSLIPDNEKLISWEEDGYLRLWSLDDGALIKSWKAHDDAINRVKFSDNGKKIVSASDDNTAKVWNSSDGNLLATLQGHTEVVTSAGFIDQDRKILTTSEDTQLKLWDALTGKLICSFTALDGGYVTILPDGYYQGDKASIKQLYYVRGLTTIGFEQLDIKYNRPDKVLQALGNPDVNLIQSYQKAYEKRIKKLNVDTTQFQTGYSVPVSDFTNRSNTQFEQKVNQLRLEIKGNDNAFKLDRFNVWVNEVPVYGQRGASIRELNSLTLDTSITINLSQGMNRIETSVININGTESYRVPLFVNHTPVVVQPETSHFIGIGIDRFKRSQYNLQYSSKDIRDLAKKLKEKYGDNIRIDTLFNESVAVSNIKQLKQKLLHTGENDKVIISYSGHGMLSKEYDYFLSTYPVDFDDPAIDGLPYDELENLLDSIPARKKLMLIDACHSGEVDKDDLITLNATSDSLIKGIKPVAYKEGSKHLGLKNSFELMQSLFVNVGKSTGATIISAAAGTQFALERNDLKNGVFTYSILEAMQHRSSIKVSELKTIVSKRVEELTKGLQKPTFRNETISADWNVW